MIAQVEHSFTGSFCAIVYARGIYGGGAIFGNNQQLKGFDLSNNDYQRAMFEAEMCEAFIKRFRAGDDVPIDLPGQFKNFAAKEYDKQFQVTQCYKRAFDIYCSLGKKEESIRLLTTLLWLVDSSDENTTWFAIHLLLALQDVTDCLEKIRVGTKEEVRDRLLRLIRGQLGKQHLDFWLLRSAFAVAKGLSGGDKTTENSIDEFRCKVLPLEAHNSYVVGNLAHASSCYAEAGTISQQLGNSERAGQFFQQASQFNRMLHSQPPVRGSIEEDLNKILAQTQEKITKEQFLPTSEQMKEQYETEENKLEAILNDERLLVNHAHILERANKLPNAGLLRWVPSQDLDQHGNPRSDFREGDTEIARLLEIAYVGQVEAIVATLFLAWRKDGHLTEEHITTQILTSSVATKYDWRIFQQGVHRYLEEDYISSVHILIPQFENILRTWTQEASIAVKKYDAHAKGTIWGQKLLGDLLSDPDVKQHLGDNLISMIKRYLDTNQPFGYRHKVAHGFINPEQCNAVLSSMLLWLTLMVVNKPLPDEATNEPSP